jgi:hypothetical protein
VQVEDSGDAAAKVGDAEGGPSDAKKFKKSDKSKKKGQ